MDRPTVEPTIQHFGVSSNRRAVACFAGYPERFDAPNRRFRIPLVAATSSTVSDNLQAHQPQATKMPAYRPIRQAVSLVTAHPLAPGSEPKSARRQKVNELTLDRTSVVSTWSMFEAQST